MHGRWEESDHSLAHKDGWTLVRAEGWFKRAEIRIITLSRLDDPFAHVLEQAVTGNPLAYKALRVVVKTNPKYRAYRATVRQIRREYWT